MPLPCDMLTTFSRLWFNQSRFTRYWEEEYCHSFFLTPDYLSLKETEPQWNMLLRGSKYKRCRYFVHYVCKCLIRFVVNGSILLLILNRKNIDLADLVNHLIMSELYEDRDTHDTLTPAFRRSVDIIDMILRIEHCNLHTNTSWYSGLSETIEVMNSYNESLTFPGVCIQGNMKIVESLRGVCLAGYKARKACGAGYTAC